MLIYIKAAIAQKEILQAESIHGSKKWLPRSHEASRQHLISWPGGGRQLNIYLHQTPFLPLDKNHNCSTKQEGVMCCNRGIEYKINAKKTLHIFIEMSVTEW